MFQTKDLCLWCPVQQERNDQGFPSNDSTFDLTEVGQERERVRERKAISGQMVIIEGDQGDMVVSCAHSMAAWWLALLPHNKKVKCVEFKCSPSVCVGSLWVVWLLPTVQKHTVGLG